LQALLTLAVIVCRDSIPLIFLGGGDAANAETVALAAFLLLIGATWFVNDGLQGIAAGALRGLNDTSVPMIYAAISFWLIGFTSGYGLAFWAGFGATGIWIGFSLSLATYAVLLIWRFDRLTARGYMPTVG
jgi:MATE family multidrug resistance protein